MHNFYLSGEEKRTMVRNDFEQQFVNLKKETDERINGLKKNLTDAEVEYVVDVLEASLRSSVKPNVKVPNKRKKIEDNKLNKKKAFAIGAATLFISGIAVGSVVSPKIVEISKINNIVNEESRDFRSDVVVPNTGYNINNNKHVYWYDYMDIYMDAKNRYEDPILSFGFVYNTLGEQYTNDSINIYNHLYGTNFQNVSDFLTKHNFKNSDELREYMANIIRAEEEELNHGSINAGR